MAESHSLDGMRMKATLGQTSARFASDLLVLYGCLCDLMLMSN